MEERRLHFRVGLMVVASLLIAAILAVFFGEIPVFQRTYLLWIRFPQAPGVTADTPVRKSGILIGRVVRHEFADDGSVIVTARIYKDVVLKQNEVCQVRGSLLGDAVLEFVPSPDPQKPNLPIDPNQLQEGIVAEDPQKLVTDFRAEFKRAVDSLETTGKKIGDIVARVDQFLTENKPEIQEMVSIARQNLTLSKTTFENLNKMLGDEQSREQLARTIRQLPDLVGKTHQAMAQLESMLREVRSFTGPLGQRGPELTARLEASLTKLDATLDQLHLFAQALNNNTGTLGQLVHNRELYDRLNRTIGNLEEVSERLRPIVEDARIFSDKVARHPGILVRDAVRPQAGFKGVPGMSPEDLLPYQISPPPTNRPGLLAPLFQPR
ncbi:MAG: MlaD family protein [Thermoguttaceae bacterium]|nr:MlaD family protein [Thermoguttaceae bacterium]MDW8037180.1 MlaD family protein [Thermoguttaceae bacterium]